MSGLQLEKSPRWHCHFEKVRSGRLIATFMAIRLVCGDGVVVTLPHEYFEKSVFNNDEIVVAHSYTLQCKARSQVVSVLLEIVEGTSENVTIPDDTVDELKSLCKELGYAGIDTQLRAFRAKTGGELG